MSDNPDDATDDAFVLTEPVILCRQGRNKTTYATSPMHAKLTGRTGPGPAGTTCGQCRFLTREQPGRKTVFKCAVNGSTRSAASDWRRKWPTCGRFEPYTPQP